MNTSIGENCLNKKNPFEYIVPPQKGSEQKPSVVDKNNKTLYFFKSLKNPAGPRIYSARSHKYVKTYVLKLTANFYEASNYQFETFRILSNKILLEIVILLYIPLLTAL